MDAVSGVFLNALGTDMTAMEEHFTFITKAFNIMLLGTRIYRELKTGDIIFEHDGKMLLKRIAAGPGNLVYIDDLTHAVAMNATPSSYTCILIIPKTVVSTWGQCHRAH